MKNKSQIWIETVIYTLIGLTIIGILLSVALPQIEKVRDKSILKQTIDAMDQMDVKILDVEQSPGSVGIVNFKISRGKFLINGTGNYTLYTLEDTRLEFSEIGANIKEGNLNIQTEKHGNRFNVYLKRDYGTLIDITVEGDTLSSKLLQAGSVPYKIYLKNDGQLTANDLTDINFKID